jgi:ribonuclease T1
MTRSSWASPRSLALVAGAIAVLLLVAFLAGGGSAKDAAPADGGAETTTSAPRGVSPEDPYPAVTPSSGLPVVAESDLPDAAARTLALVRAGGPYVYDEDGRVFGNRERLLPRRPRGYYREYTVPTPGEDDRGPRRLVAGRAGDLYWTTDHYASFRQIRVGR